MDYYTGALLLIICLLIYLYIQKNLRYFEKLGVPYLSGWPILGSFTDPILQRKHVSEVFQELYDLHPGAKYVGAFDFTKPVFVIRDLDLLKSITIKHFDNFPDHRPLGDETLDPLFGGSLFNLQGQQWKDSRTVLSPSFTSSKMKMMYSLMVECVESFMNFINEQSSEKMKMVDTKDLITKYTSDVIATCAFGIKIDSFKDPKNQFFILAKQAAIIGPILSLKMNISRVFPGLMKALKIRIFSQKITDFFTNIISTTVKMRDEQGIYRPDMLQLMMEARDQGTKNVRLDITGMTSQAFIFFFAGFESTSTSICLIAHELAINPEVQSKLQEEIDGVMKETNGKPTYEAIKSMQYLDATFHEIMRLHGPASFLDRICKVPFELPPTLPGCKPITLQPGSQVWIPSAAIHRDPKYYDDPCKFNPDRYYGKKITTSDTTTLGFGIGPRGCIGNRFAILETKILLIHLLAKYTFSPNEKTCAPLIYDKKSMSTQPKGGFWLTIKRRS